MLALGAVKYSAIVQGACVVASSLVFLSIGIDLSNTSVFIDYLVLFMISSIVSILPISLGGIGLREITFVYGALLIPSIDPELGVAFSMICYIINALISFTGIWFYMRIDQTLAKG